MKKIECFYWKWSPKKIPFKYRKYSCEIKKILEQVENDRKEFRSITQIEFNEMSPTIRFKILDCLQNYFNLFLFVGPTKYYDEELTFEYNLIDYGQRRTCYYNYCNAHEFECFEKAKQLFMENFNISNGCTLYFSSLPEPFVEKMLEYIKTINRINDDKNTIFRKNTVCFYNCATVYIVSIRKI